MIESPCECTQRHVPLPQTYMKITTGGTVYELCPTTYFNVRHLMDWYRIIGDQPPGSVTKHYSKFVRDLVSSMSTDTILADPEGK